MRSRIQEPPITIGDAIGLFLILFNTLGTTCWVHLYISGEYTQWWVIGLIIICGLAAVIPAVKIIVGIVNFFRNNKIS